MTAVKAYYDGKTFIPMQTYAFKPHQQVLIVIDENDKKGERSYSHSLASFRSRYADFLSNPAENEGLDSVFDGVRDTTEQLRGTEDDEW